MSRLNLLGRVGIMSALVAASNAVMLPAFAQDAQPQQPPPAPRPAPAPGSIGQPGIGDFQLQPRERIVTQPAPTQPQPTPPPAPVAQPSAPVQRVPAPTQAPAERPVQAAPRDTAPPPRAPGAETSGPAPAAAEAPVPATGTTPPPAPASETPKAADPAPKAANSGDLDAEGVPMWLVLLGGIGLGVIAYMIYTRRREAKRRLLALPAPDPVATMAAATPSAPRAPRPDPVPRPWLEVEFTPERTTADPDESNVEFEMCIRNSGGSAARNIRLQAKLICSTPDQDKEIAAFHRKKPGEHRTLDIPDIAAGQEIRLKGRVDVKREDLKALRMEQRLLWVPLVAVNAFYDWGTSRTGQTSKSFLVGREKHEASEKMAPFRLDLGPRVYRTVGQRPYKIERRV